MNRRRATIRGSGPRPVPITWLDPVAASPIELAVGGLLLIIIGLLALVWGAAFFSSLLANGEAADLSVGDAAVAMARLGNNRLAWDGVWAPDVEEALAGPRWFWLVFAVEGFLLGLAFWPAWRLLGPRPAEPMSVVIEEATAKHPRRDRREADRAARAERRALRRVEAVDPPPLAPDSEKVIVEAPNHGRLVLGRVGERLVATEKHHSVLALGPTRSGKTAGLALPAVLEWDGPALVVSAKSDLVSLAWDERAKGNGETWLFDPTASMASIAGSGHRSVTASGWSPLQVIDAVPRPRNEPELDQRVHQWALARRSARWMVNGVRSAGNSADMPAPWYGATEQMLAPLLLAAAADEMSIDQVIGWVDRRDDAAVRHALERSGVAEAIAAWDGAHHFDAATTVGCYQILGAILHPFGDPVLLAQTNEPQISAQTLLDGKPNTLFVLAPPNHQDRLRPVLATIVSEVIDTAMNQANASQSGRLESPLLVVIDDAAGSVPIELIDQLAAVGAGLGIQLLTLIQDLSQLSPTYGQPRSTHLADSHRARVVLPGITDPFTLDYLNVLIRGNRLVEPGSEGRGGHGTADEAIVSRTATWMRTLDDDNAVLIYGNLAPIRMQLRPWYGDKALTNRLNPPEQRQRWGRLARLRRRNADIAVGGFPNPFDSEANDAEADRYWDAVKESGLLPEPLEFDDGTTGRQADDPTR